MEKSFKISDQVAVMANSLPIAGVIIDILVDRPGYYNIRLEDGTVIERFIAEIWPYIKVKAS
jgi:hypothetical protein